MKEVRFFYAPDAESKTELPAEEVTHAVKVLRLQEGDDIFLIDGKGYFFKAQIDTVSNKHCFYHIVEKLVQRSEEHTPELQSRQYPVCRLLLEQKHRPEQATSRRLTRVNH